MPSGVKAIPTLHSMLNLSSKPLPVVVVVVVLVVLVVVVLVVLVVLVVGGSKY